MMTYWLFDVFGVDRHAFRTPAISLGVGPLGCSPDHFPVIRSSAARDLR